MTRHRGRILGCLVVAVMLGVANAPPARADYTSCSYDGVATVTATLTSDTQGYMRVGGGGAIVSTASDGSGPTTCGAGTVANTDTIVLNGAASPQCHHISLEGGSFTPGKTAEADGGASEIEFSYSPTGPQVNGGCIVVTGGAGADHLVAGKVAGSGGARQLNLNSDEAVDDVDLVGTSGMQVNLEGGGGADVISANGSAETGGQFQPITIYGGPGGDDLTGPTTDMEGGPGDDHLTSPAGLTTFINYDDAAGPVSVSLPGGTTAGGDGDGSTDTYTSTSAPFVRGSPHDDTLNGTDGVDTLSGGGGKDTFNAFAGNDVINVYGAGTTNIVSAGDGSDLIFGGPGNDVIHGDGAGDDLIGRTGDDQLFGDAGNDTFSEGDFGGEQDDNGADVFHGGEGVDRVAYADTATTYFSQSISRFYGVKVSMDGVADDGEYLGQPGSSDNDEHDNVMPDVESAVGTYGPDVLVGSSVGNTLIGFKGKDTISGGGGDDVVQSNGVPAFATDAQDTGDDILDGGPGEDFIRGFGGADTVTSRDGEADDVACGDKIDSETGDTLDKINADCETSDVIFVAPPVAPSPTPGPTPAPQPPATTPRPPASTAPVTKPTFASLVRLPAVSKKHKCVSRRLFRIRLTVPKADTILSAVVVLNGKTLKTLKGKRVTSVVDLRGLPKGRFTVKVTLQLKSGTTVTGTRKYRTCARKK